MSEKAGELEGQDTKATLMALQADLARLDEQERLAQEQGAVSAEGQFQRYQERKEIEAKIRLCLEHDFLLLSQCPLLEQMSEEGRKQLIHQAQDAWLAHLKSLESGSEPSKLSEPEQVEVEKAMERLRQEGVFAPYIPKAEDTAAFSLQQKQQNEWLAQHSVKQPGEKA